LDTIENRSGDIRRRGADFSQRCNLGDGGRLASRSPGHADCMHQCGLSIGLSHLRCSARPGVSIPPGRGVRRAAFIGTSFGFASCQASRTKKVGPPQLAACFVAACFPIERASKETAPARGYLLRPPSRTPDGGGLVSQPGVPCARHRQAQSSLSCLPVNRSRPVEPLLDLA
jgi:hypothetical protein